MKLVKLKISIGEINVNAASITTILDQQNGRTVIVLQGHDNPVEIYQPIEEVIALVTNKEAK